MKHKLQTLLKHKLQWLLLLAALLGVSQGVWAGGDATGSIGVYMNVNGTSTWYTVYKQNWGMSCSGYDFDNKTSISGVDLGTVTTLKLGGLGVIGWTDSGNDWVAARVAWKIDSGSTTNYNVGNYGSPSSGKANVQCTSGNNRVTAVKSEVNLISGVSAGSHTLTFTPYQQMQWKDGGNSGTYNSYTRSNVSCTFTVPGWTTTSGTKAMGSVGVGSNTSATVSLGTHYGATSTATSSVSGTNASDFTVTAVSATSVTVKFAPSAAGSRTATVTITDAYSKTYTLTVSGTGTTSCSTPTANDITISAPASTTTLYLSTGSAPSVTQTVTATCSKGNTYLWSATPTSMSYTGAWGAGTATRAAFTSSGSKSTTATFYHEGVYTATFAAGCGNTTDASKNAPTITVKPGHIYFDGPFFSGSGYDLTKQHVAINTSTSQFVYEWTAAYTTGDFVISVGNACNNLASSAYTIGNYADVTKTGVTMGSSGNHNFSPNIGTIKVGDRLKLTITYNGVNASSKPQYAVKLEKVCSNPTAQAVSGTAAICSGSSTNVTVASSQSGYTYKLYKGGSATATTKTGTGSALNFPVSEAGTYTVHAYYTSGSDAYCKADMTGSATVTVTPTASIGSVTLSSSSVCIGQGLSATANSVVLGGGTGAWSSSNTSIATVASTGVITPKAAGSTNITYTITGGCGGTVSKYATLTVKPNAAAAQYTLTNNTQTYNGAPRAVTVTPASGAGTATIYYTGTGGTSYAKSTTAPINAGTYAITVNAGNGTNYCAATNLSVGTLTINKANQSTLTISNTATDLVYCDAANVKLTTSGGSGDGAVTYTVTSGSGSVDGDVLSPSAKGSVSVTATKAASQNFNATTSEPKTFNFNKTAPTVYTLSNVGDATTICGDPSSGAGSGTLRLANSQTGYKYQLYSNGAPIEGYAAKAGTTGSSIDFPVTSSGTYTVYAYYGDNSTNCPTLMDGEITLTISTQPRLVRSAAIVSQYTPVTITCISTDIETWEVTNAGSTAYLYDQTYNSVDFKGASTNSPYTITATTKGGCSETTTITVNTDHEDCN
ncbi:MAG: hypothetical protein IJR06_03475 [Paludibacteraceae bacterium]|nr:hypothetical protein [Paludibacteraceae bacterium]